MLKLCLCFKGVTDIITCTLLSRILWFSNYWDLCQYCLYFSKSFVDIFNYHCTLRIYSLNHVTAYKRSNKQHTKKQKTKSCIQISKGCKNWLYSGIHFYIKEHIRLASMLLASKIANTVWDKKSERKRNMPRKVVMHQ